MNANEWIKHKCWFSNKGNVFYLIQFWSQVTLFKILKIVAQLSVELQNNEESVNKENGNQQPIVAIH